MGFVVKVREQGLKQPEKAVALNNPWDWDSFTWGFTVGGIVVTVLGGTILYFTWPYVIAVMKMVPFFREAVEEAKARGLV